jgi:hypothetical protein
MALGYRIPVPETIEVGGIERGELHATSVSGGSGVPVYRQLRDIWTTLGRRVFQVHAPW